MFGVLLSFTERLHGMSVLACLKIVSNILGTGKTRYQQRKLAQSRGMKRTGAIKRSKKKPEKELHRRKTRDQARVVVGCLRRHGKRSENSSDKCLFCFDDDENCELTYFYGQNCDSAANHLLCTSCAIDLFEITRKHDATCPICRQVLINKKKR